MSSEEGDGLPRTFFRIVRSTPPTQFDFMSNSEKGKRPRTNNPEVVRLWGGISVYDTWGRAHATARAFPYLGVNIAEMRIPDDGTIISERTTESPGHFTLWGDAERLLGCVTSVWSLDRVVSDEMGDQ